MHFLGGITAYSMWKGKTSQSAKGKMKNMRPSENPSDRWK